MPRLFAALCAGALLAQVFAAQPAAAQPSAVAAWLKPAARAQEQALRARIGIAVLRPDGSAAAVYRADERFPLNSTSKVLVCAALLRGAEQGAPRLNDKTAFARAALVSYSPITAKFTAPKQMTWRQLCAAAVSHSDNTAANLVSAKMGGPRAITVFLRLIGDRNTRLDRYEPALNSAAPGDKRDTTTPLAASRTLRALLSGDALQLQSRLQLAQWMRADAVADNLLRASLPRGWGIADKSGAGAHGARSVIAAVYPRQNGRQSAPWFVAIYISQTQAPLFNRDKAIAALGAVIFSAIANMQR